MISITFIFFISVIFLPPLILFAIPSYCYTASYPFVSLFMGLFVLMITPLWIVTMLAAPFWLFVNYFYLKIVPEEFRITERYVGVVITTTNLTVYRYIFVYASGIFLLIEYLKRKNQPFKLLRKFDKKKFSDMIYDKNCKGLYILGHGTRHGLRVSKDEMVYYCEFANAPKKEFIIQLHCNHLRGKSLVEYLDAQSDFSMETTRTVNDNQNYFFDKLKEELKIDVFDIFRDFIFASITIVYKKLKVFKIKSSLNH